MKTQIALAAGYEACFLPARFSPVARPLAPESRQIRNRILSWPTRTAWRPMYSSLRSADGQHFRIHSPRPCDSHRVSGPVRPASLHHRGQLVTADLRDGHLLLPLIQRRRRRAAGAPPGVDAGATVVSSGRVGFLDWVQLKADTEASFTDWLTANGYPYSTAASSVFSYYVQKGWYFVAFKISQGAVPDSGSGEVCNALGPVKLSFTSSVPVVPSRMASAATATGTYASGFSWRIFGITTGDQQLAFTDGANTNRVLGYSGALTASDVSSLAVLAQAGDRLTKLTLTFAYGSTDPDVGLNLASASDYREIRYTTQYVRCDAGTGTAIDAAADSSADGRLAPKLR